jgi:Nif-specific regulatory protein
MDPTIQITGGVGQSLSFKITNQETSIGRLPSNEIHIPDQLISRLHCRIVKQTENDEVYYLLIDQSSNGTEVNDRRIDQHRLEHGDVIRLGKNTLLFLCHESVDAVSGENTVEIQDDTLDDPPAVAALSIDEHKSLFLGTEPDKIEPGKVNRVLKEFNNLVLLGLGLNSIKTPEEIHRKLCEGILASISAERGAIVLYGSSEKEIKSAFQWPRRRPGHEKFTISKTILQRIVSDGKTTLIPNLLSEAELSNTDSLYKSGIHSILAAPLKIEDRILGVIYLDSRSSASQFNPEDADLLTAIAAMAATAYANAERVAQLEDEKRLLRDELNFDREMVGESQAILSIRRFISAIAKADSTVLIRGESGTGKEIVARAIHKNSLRADKPFVSINCATLESGLLGSELFGHEKGAFTGATATKKGKLEVASGGTVFLDEIGELAPELQAKLLRVLQEREIQRVGSNDTIKIDIRLIAATNKDLEAAIREKTFREDLFYRVNVFSITMPPLRDRRNDIPLLAKHFLEKFKALPGVIAESISHEAIECLRRYSWPGNVRELENAIERAVVLARGERILPGDLPITVLPTQPASMLDDSSETSERLLKMRYHEALREAKKRIILDAIDEARGEMNRAAEILAIHPNNLYRYLRELDLKGRVKGVR